MQHERTRRPRWISWSLAGSLALMVGLWTEPAQAYIDPGTGSMILQAVLAAIIGVGMFFKGLRLKVMSLFVRPKAREKKPD